MKQRVMSRAEIARVMLNERNRVEKHEETTYSHGNKREQAAIDLMFHLLADGQTVKIYVDHNMGGTVVEIAD